MRALVRFKQGAIFSYTITLRKNVFRLVIKPTTMDNFKQEVGWLEIEILSDPPAKSWRLPTQDVFYPSQASRARRLPFNCAGSRRQLLQDALKKPRRKTKEGERERVAVLK